MTETRRHGVPIPPIVQAHNLCLRFDGEHDELVINDVVYRLSPRMMILLGEQFHRALERIARAHLDI